MTVLTGRNKYLPVISEWAPVILGVFLLYLPTYINLSNTIWQTDQQGHGPVILLLIVWLLWQKRVEINQLPAKPSKILGWPLLAFGLCLYVIGRSQDILLFEVGSQIIVITSLLLLMRGINALKYAWFPLLAMVFMVPLPSTIVDALTLPMKISVSWATDQILYWFGFPISRSGVILHIGQYKLLVADACAGLNTLFALEAMGLFYLHLIQRESLFRNIFLAIAIVPISFTANTIRVISLALITYYFGDEAGQGFLHGFASITLFITALLLIIAVDSALQFVVRYRERHTQGAVRYEQVEHD